MYIRIGFEFTKQYITLLPLSYPFLLDFSHHCHFLPSLRFSLYPLASVDFIILNFCYYCHLFAFQSSLLPSPEKSYTMWFNENPFNMSKNRQFSFYDKSTRNANHTYPITIYNMVFPCSFLASRIVSSHVKTKTKSWFVIIPFRACIKCFFPAAVYFHNSCYCLSPPNSINQL